MTRQKTVKKEFVLEGKGLHTGADVRMRVKPAPVDSGILFQRIDIAGAPQWRLCPGQMGMNNANGRCTIIGSGDAAVQTIEHAAAALFGMGVDNALIEIDGPELPGMDGSALPFAKAVLASGLEEQAAPRPYLTLKAPVSVSKGDASISIFPSEDFKVTYVLDYSQFGLGPHVVNFSFDGNRFFDEIAPARTFCLRQEAEVLKKAGFGKGADTQNTLVIDHGSPIENTLRFDDECARHKVADLIGDLSFLGKRIRGHVVAVRSGHYLNACLVKALYDQNEKKRFPVDKPAAAGNAGIAVSGVMDALPHRYPFLLVDRVIEIEPGKRAVGLKNLTVNELFFQGHFPQRPIMPGVLMIEAMAQVGGVLLNTVEGHDNQIGLFMAVDRVKFRRTASPGDQLIMEVEVVRNRSRMASVRATSKVDGQLVVEAEMMFAFQDRDEIFG